MWSKKHEKCVTCGTTDKRCKGWGMCVNCYDRSWSKNNSEKIKRRGKKYRLNNFKNIRIRQKKWREKNFEKEKERKRKYYLENIEKEKKRRRIYYLGNIEKINKGKNVYKRERIKKDVHFKLRHRISHAISKKLHFRLSSKKGKSTFSFLPYTIDDLIHHLENLFKPGMNWTNYGSWHIDHKIPDCKFDYKNVEDKEFQKCWALNNLQPLWAEENLRKGGKLI